MIHTLRVAAFAPQYATDTMTAEIRRRRITFLLLCLVTLGFFMTAMLALIVTSGMTLSEWLIGLGFMLTMPYMVISFWNAAIGLWLRRRCPESIHAMPGVAELRHAIPPSALSCDTALVMTLRNEVPEPVFGRLARMRESLAATGQLPRFTFVILSDSDRADVIQAEAQTFREFCDQKMADEPKPVYRHRVDNRGYKAGNIREFVDTDGQEFDYFIPLDADSLMSGGVIVRMVATMQARSEIGILQSLVVGMPSTSGFARVFQFGMRHAMRAFTTGAAWWTADCGNYWGHNAVIRMTPFRGQCRLPELPGSPPLGGAVLSHDQLEAAFMRRAGFEVRVIPVESDSYEINPPTLLDFIRRELRWCQGNMQYLRLLATPGLKPVSRVQLLIAIGMYVSQATWIGMLAISCVGSLIGDFRSGNLELGLALFFGVFFLSIAPKVFGAADVWLSSSGPARYGGLLVFSASVCMELVSSMLMAPVVALSVALFLLRLTLGKGMNWHAQNRECLDIAWREACRVLIPHTLAGIGLAAALWWVGGFTALIWGLPVIAGLALAVPYAVFGARSALGGRLAHLGLFGIPEEQNVPSVLAVKVSGHDHGVAEEVS